MKPFAANPEVQAEIAKLVPLLQALSVNGILAYENASKAIGRDVRREARYSLLRARQQVEKDDGVRFAVITNVGIKRLSADDVPAIGSYAIKHLHRTAKTAVKRLSDLRAYNDMQPEDRLRIAGMRLVASHVAEKTERKAVKEVEDSVRQAGAAIDFGTVLGRK